MSISSHKDKHVQEESEIVPVPLPERSTEIEKEFLAPGADRKAEKKPQTSASKKPLYIIAGGGVLLLVIMVVVGALLYSAPHEPDKVARLRDMAIILLALESAIIGVVLLAMVLAITYLALKVYELTETVQNKVVPLLEKIDSTTSNVLEKSVDTVNTVHGTTTFVSEKVVEPVITVAGHVGAIREIIKTFAGKRSK